MWPEMEQRGIGPAALLRELGITVVYDSPQVGQRLRVRGVAGPRIMDTPIMPQIPSGNTNGPTMAMAWRAADIIAARR